MRDIVEVALYSLSGHNCVKIEYSVVGDIANMSNYHAEIAKIIMQKLLRRYTLTMIAYGSHMSVDQIMHFVLMFWLDLIHYGSFIKERQDEGDQANQWLSRPSWDRCCLDHSSLNVRAIIHMKSLM